MAKSKLNKNTRADQDDDDEDDEDEDEAPRSKGKGKASKGPSKSQRRKPQDEDDDEDEDDDDEEDEDDEDEDDEPKARSKSKSKSKASGSAKEGKGSKGKASKKGRATGYSVIDEDTLKIRLNNVRLSFPAIFTPKAVGDDAKSTPKFSAVLLLSDDDHADTIEFLQEKADELAKTIGMKKLPISKCFLKPGSEKDDLEGFEDHHFVSASNARRPLAIDSDKSAVTESDGVFYPGCYVNAVVQLWAQDNKWGKRVNASLEGVQFCADGESLGGGTIADEDDFE